MRVRAPSGGWDHCNTHTTIIYSMLGEISYVSIKEVKPNKANPRVIRDDKFRKLVKSIREFPDMLRVRPLVVNGDMETLGGNMRLKACKEAGLKEVPVMVVEGWDEDRQKEFVIKDNLGYGEWDWEMLANEWDTEKLEEWGMDVWQGEAMEDEGDESEGEDKGDEVKRVYLEVRDEVYEEMLDVLRFWRERGANVGDMVFDILVRERDGIEKKR